MAVEEQQQAVPVRNKDTLRDSQGAIIKEATL